ncbi:ankyrin repeat protein [Nannochloropsis oceanica]
MGTAFGSPASSSLSSSAFSSSNISSTSSSPPSSTARRAVSLPRHNPSWAFQTAVSETLQRRGYIEALWDALVDGDKATHRPPIPCEVLPLILHYAASFKEVALSKEEHIQLSNGDYLYLTHPIPFELHGYEVVGAQILVTSHDQGWSSEFPHLKGTYIGSYTWGEAVVVESGAPTGVTEGGSQRVVLAQEVYRNLHAVKTWQTHEKSFVVSECVGDGVGVGCGGCMEERRQSDGGHIVAALRPGRALTLKLHAMYAGWVNHTRWAQITVQYLKVA